MLRRLIDRIPTLTPEQGDRAVNLTLAFTAGFITAMLAFQPAHASEIDDVFNKIGFTKTNRGVNRTIYATYERPMTLPACNRFIQILSTEFGEAPANIVETNTMRVVRFRNIERGSVLFTCDGRDIIANLSKNPG